MITNSIYDEEDEMTDEEFFSQNSDNTFGDSDSEDEIEDEDDKFKVSEGDYKVRDITDRFLKYESQIMCEDNRTEIKFAYRGATYKGIVMQQFPTSKDDYIFLVQQIGKNVPSELKGKKVMKKIHVPDASLIS